MPSLITFDVTVLEHGTTRTVAVAGEVDIATAGEVRAALAVALPTAAETVVLDLGGVTFLDSSGVHAVLDAVRHAQALGRRFVVLPGPAPVHEVFELAGVTGHVPFASERTSGRAGTVTPRPAGQPHRDDRGLPG